MRNHIVILGLMLTTGISFGQNLREKTTIIGLKGGLITSGTVSAEDVEFDTDLSYSLGAFGDYQLAPKFSGGIAVDLHNISVSDESKMLLNFGVTLKAMISGENSSMAFRPGLLIGYARLPEIEGRTKSSQYFTVGGLVEIAFSTQNSVSFFTEAGIYAAPSGGNSEFDITFGPMFLLRGGVYF
jgi:hypothetical protein